MPIKHSFRRAKASDIGRHDCNREDNITGLIADFLNDYKTDYFETCIKLARETSEGVYPENEIRAYNKIIDTLDVIDSLSELEKTLLRDK